MQRIGRRVVAYRFVPIASRQEFRGATREPPLFGAADARLWASSDDTVTPQRYLQIHRD